MLAQCVFPLENLQKALCRGIQNPQGNSGDWSSTCWRSQMIPGDWCRAAWIHGGTLNSGAAATGALRGELGSGFRTTSVRDVARENGVNARRTFDDAREQEYKREYTSTPSSVSMGTGIRDGSNVYAIALTTDCNNHLKQASQWWSRTCLLHQSQITLWPAWAPLQFFGHAAT